MVLLISGVTALIATSVMGVFTESSRWIRFVAKAGLGGTAVSLVGASGGNGLPGTLEQFSSIGADAQESPDEAKACKSFSSAASKVSWVGREFSAAMRRDKVS